MDEHVRFEATAASGWDARWALQEQIHHEYERTVMITCAPDPDRPRRHLYFVRVVHRRMAHPVKVPVTTERVRKGLYRASAVLPRDALALLPAEP